MTVRGWEVNSPIKLLLDRADEESVTFLEPVQEILEGLIRYAEEAGRRVEIEIQKRNIANAEAAIRAAEEELARLTGVEGVD